MRHRCVGAMGQSIDDIWELGKPVGTGGPWKDTEVKTINYLIRT